MLKQLQYTSILDRNDALKLNYVTVSDDVLRYFNSDSEKNRFNLRVMISINGCEPWHGGVVALGNNTGYITVKTAIMRKLGVKLDDEVTVVLTEDDSEYGMEFPVELAEIFAQDEEVFTRFKALKLSMQRYMIYSVLQVKSSQKRIERGIKMLNELKLQAEGNEDLKAILKAK